MRYAKQFALTLAALLVTSIATFALPVDAQEGHVRTLLTLGIKKDFDGKPAGDQENALPSLVSVGETVLVYGRLMQFPTGKNFQPLPDGQVKLIDIFNRPTDPIVLATAQSDEEGYFVFEWEVSVKKFKELGFLDIKEGITALENLRLQVLGVYDGDSSHAKSTSRGYIVNLKPLRLDVGITTDKPLYIINEAAQVTVLIRDAELELTDPDTIQIFFDSANISPVRQSIGTYFFTSPPLSEKLHKVTVIADKEEYLRETRTATITASATVDLPVDLNVKLGQDTYGLGDFIVITGTAKPVVEGRVVLINVVNPNGETYNFGHATPNADGTFKDEIKLLGPLAVAGQWKVTVTYFAFQSTASFNVKEIPSQFLQVAVRSSSVVNDLGETLDEGLLGSPIGIQTELANDERQDIALTYIVQVTDAQGFTAMVSWIKGIVLKPSMSIKPAIFWIPEDKGDFKVEIFVWESFQNPTPLSQPKTLKIGIA
ncbi:MAG: hypothetical protein ACE5KA_05480 [Nitrososphaerales archaeon]